MTSVARRRRLSSLETASPFGAAAGARFFRGTDDEAPLLSDLGSLIVAQATVGCVGDDAGGASQQTEKHSRREPAGFPVGVGQDFSLARRKTKLKLPSAQIDAPLFYLAFTSSAFRLVFFPTSRQLLPAFTMPAFELKNSFLCTQFYPLPSVLFLHARLLAIA